MQRLIPCALAASVLTSCSTTPPFDPADVNKDRRLDINEFRTYAVNDRFDAFDTYKDGRVSFQEWKAHDPTATPVTFADRDFNNDGFVTRDEALVSARRLGTTDTVFHLIDTNRNGLIDEPEIAAYARKVGAAPPPQ